MTIIIKNNKLYLEADNQEYALTPMHLMKYPELNNLIGKEVSKEIAFDIICESAYNDACKILGHSRKTSFEIKQKLRLKNYPFIVIDEVITKLINLKILNDTDYAISFAKKKISSYGKRIIVLKLREKGINENIINDILTGIDEETVLDKLIPLKLKAHKGSFRIIKEKVHHYFYQKGYDSSLIDKIINHSLPLLKLNPIADLKLEFKKVQVRFNGYQNNLKMRSNLIKYLQKKCFSIEDILEIID